MFGFGGYTGKSAYGRAPQNPHFPGNIVTVISFLMLILAILVLLAQIGLYYYCDWQSVCLVLPAFVACMLFILTSILGIATGVERTNGLILSLLAMSLITVIVTPINMGMWALPANSGGIPLKFSLIGDGSTASDTLAAVHWGLLFVPILQWFLFVIITAVCARAICCPPVYPPGQGYNPNAVYGRALAARRPFW